MQKAKSLSPSPTDEAFKAVWAADYHRALALLHNVDLPGCASMRARIWLRLRRIDRLTEEYGRRDISSYEPHDGVQLAGFTAAGLALVGEFERSKKILSSASSRALEVNDTLLIAFCLYTKARVAGLAEDFESAGDLLSVAEATLADSIERFNSDRYSLSLSAARSHIYDTKAWIFATLRKFQEQEEALLRAANFVTAAPEVDRYFEATILSNLAALVYRRPLESSRSFLAARLDEGSGSSLTDVFKTQIRRALTSNAFLFGSDGKIAPVERGSASTLATRLASCLDALFYDYWHDSDQFFARFRFSVAIALDIDWENDPGPELQDLLNLAILVAPFDSALSEKLKSIYDRYVPNVSSIYYSLRWAETSARLAFLNGCLAKVHGDLARAELCFADASAKYNADKQNLNEVSHPHEAILGIERFSVTRNETDLVSARMFVARHRSPFSHRLADALRSIENADCYDFPYLGMYGLKAQLDTSISARAK